MLELGTFKNSVHQFIRSGLLVPPQDYRTVEYLLDLVLGGELKESEAESAVFAASRSLVRNNAIYAKVQQLRSSTKKQGVLNFLKDFTF